MKRDFVAWHNLKAAIEAGQVSPLFREQEVWWCSLGANIGIEEDGKNELFERPVLVMRKCNKEMLWALPMTSKPKEGRFYQSFELHKKQCTVLLSHIRTLSGQRLIRRVGKLSDTQFEIVQRAFQELLNETDPLRGPRVPNGNLYSHSKSRGQKSQGLAA